jgi:hypothetical protein
LSGNQYDLRPTGPGDSSERVKPPQPFVNPVPTGKILAHHIAAISFGRFATSPIFAADDSRPKRSIDPVVSLLRANLNRPPANPAMY